MTTLSLRLVIDDSDVGAELERKQGMLMTAIAEAVDTVNLRLYERVEEKLSGEVLQRRTGTLAGAVDMQAARFVGAVCAASVGIDDGHPSFLVGLVQEYGGEKWYDIYPVNAKVLAFMGGAYNPETLGHASSVSAMVFTPHVHHPPLPERSYLRSSLAEMEDLLYSELTEALTEVLAA
jgi:hypothetical protein